MNRNVESHFSSVPKAPIRRSTFDRSFEHITSFNTGELIPFYCEEVLPGDTFKVKTSIVARMQTLLDPIFSNIYVDTYYFYVPFRLVMDHFKAFYGENIEGPWYPTTEYAIPYVSYPEGGFAVGSLADYFGVPVGVVPTSVGADTRDYPSALPFRAYGLIVDNWFRDQNYQDPVYVPKDDTNQTGSNGTDYVTDICNGGMPFVANKFHDYFSSALPSPLKHEPVNIFGTLADVAGSGYVSSPYIPVFSGNNRLPDSNVGDVVMQGYISDGADPPTYQHNYVRKHSSSTNLLVDPNASTLGFIPSNLWADVSTINMSISDLRLAFQMQRYYEKCARVGSRYREIVLGHFGVSMPDSRAMIPEYLGGHRFPLSIHQVANQSQGESDFLGDLGAMSNTADVHDDFVRSFSEPGLIIGVLCSRYDHLYTQGLERFWSRRHTLDFYWPEFQALSEQPVYKREIYLDNSSDGGAVWAYQEAWADYRYKPSRASALMRPGVSGSLATWHLGDYYTQQPSMSAEWLHEDKGNVDRVLAVTSQLSNQIFADIYVKNIATRPMPLFSVPGLADHF